MPPHESGGKRRLAVLPLANISPDPKDEFFSDGLTEELISTLSKIANLGVIARTSVMRYKATTKSIRDVGRELSVGTVLEGSVRRSGNKIRITVQLIDAASDEHLWSEVYDRDLEDVFAIQSEIAQRVARALRVQIRRAEKAGIERKPTEVPEAYALYLQGRVSLNLRTEPSLRKAIDLFQDALARDSRYALAYTGLADAYAVLALLEFAPPNEAFPKARAAAAKALEVDNRLAEAHTSLGLVRFQYDWDWSGAEAEFRRSLELNPNYPQAHQFFADYLKAMGRFDEAIAEMNRALELDPLSLAISTGLGHVLYLSRQYDRAIDQYGQALRLDPGFVQAHLWFGRPYLQKGMFEEAIAELTQAVTLSRESTVSLATIGQAYAAAGRTAEARETLQQLLDRAQRQYVPSYWISLVYAALGERDQAFAWLDKALQERS
ncbi:MAG TPA: tetratricopeptide repeat protein, partial [Thermoplasmata archaeon]|nr:tetratricopeptide repeat protein [Thermoplasmata archaeon]